MSDRDAVLPSSGELGKEIAHRTVEVKTTFIDHHHGHGGGDDDLGETGQVEQSVHGHRRGIRLIGPFAVSLEMNQAAVAANRHHRARESFPLDESVDRRVDVFERARFEVLRIR